MIFGAYRSRHGTGHVSRMRCSASATRGQRCIADPGPSPCSESRSLPPRKSNVTRLRAAIQAADLGQARDRSSVLRRDRSASCAAPRDTRASFARRAGAAILMPNRNAVFFVEAHGPHCHHRADAARGGAGARRAGATGGAAAGIAPPAPSVPPSDPAAAPPPSAAPAEQNAAAPPAAPTRPPSDADLRDSVCLMIESVGAGAQPAARILRAGDLAGEPVPARRGRPAHAQRRARPGHRPVHAAHRGRARPARSVRSGAGAAEIGRVPARARRPVRQSRAGGGGLQCRAAAGARLAVRARARCRRRRATTCSRSPGSRPTNGRAAASASRCSRRGRTARS